MMRLLLVLILLCTGGLAAASSLDLLGRIERLMLYPFDSRVATPPEGMAARIWSREDVDLVLWTAPPRQGAPTLVYFQGNAGHLGARSERFKRMMAQGFGLVALSTRGGGAVFRGSDLGGTVHLDTGGCAGERSGTREPFAPHPRPLALT